MASVTYYFPSTYGAAVTDTTGGNGEQTIPAGGAQYSSGYTVVYVPDTTKGNYVITVGFDSTTVAPQQFNATQSAYSDANHNEVISEDGKTDFFVQTSPYNTSQGYAFPATSTQFTPSASFETPPAPVSPTEDFAHDYALTKNADGTFKITASSSGGPSDYGAYTIQDYRDSGATSDNLAQLGDIANDHFAATSDTDTTLQKPIYVGKTSDGGIVGGLGKSYFLYTNNAYSANDPVGVDTSADTLPCFAGGTLIRTLRGDVPVEALRVGDEVVTASGARRPIRWLGHRTIECRGHATPRTVLPVRIAAHAFGADRPARDLLVSPGHALCVDISGADIPGEVLIPASTLINGTTIRQIDVATVTYWHVELDSHDILLAENMPAESYLDMGNRAFFAEGGGLDAPLDGVPAQHAAFCRPFHDRGLVVAVARERLAARARLLGWTLDAASAFADLHLLVDGARVEPSVRGLAARFAVPAGARDVWLVTSTVRPCDVGCGDDSRDLGLQLGGLAIADGFEYRVIAIDDSRLVEGFHAVEDGGYRWTADRARLPAALWDGIADDGFYLRVDLAGPALPRWVAPQDIEPADLPLRVAA